MSEYETKEAAQAAWHAFIDPLAAALGEGWTVEARETESRFDRGTARLTRASDGLSVYASEDTYRGKVEFGVNWPMDGHSLMSGRDWGALAHGELEPHASVSRTRDPAGAARDVLRKVIEPAASIWPKVAERQKHLADTRDGLRRAAEALANTLGAAPWGNNKTERLTIGSYDAQAVISRHGSGEFTFRGTWTEIQAIAKAAKDIRP